MGFNIYIFYIISIFAHLGSRVPILGMIRIDLLLTAVLFVFIQIDKKSDTYVNPGDDKISANLKWLIVFIVLSLPFVEWPGSVIRNGSAEFIKAVVFYYFTVHFIKTEKQLKIFLYTFLSAQAFRCFEPLWLHLTTGYWGSRAYIGGGEFAGRLGGAPHDIVNPNGLAFVIVSVFILHHYLSRGLKIKYRLIYFAALPMYLYALVLTSSRTGFLALGISACVIIWQSEKKFLMLTVCILIGAIAFTQLDDQQKGRYYSIFGGGTEEQHATAIGRWEGTKVALISFLEKPIVGHGLGTSAETGYHSYGSAAPAHNLFAEILQEIGLIGFIIYLRFIYSIFTVTKSIISVTGKNNSVILLQASYAITVYFFMNLLFSFATYGLSRYPWYFCAGVTAVIHFLSEQDGIKIGSKQALSI